MVVVNFFSSLRSRTSNLPHPHFQDDGATVECSSTLVRKEVGKG